MLYYEKVYACGTSEMCVILSECSKLEQFANESKDLRTFDPAQQTFGA